MMVVKANSPQKVQWSIDSSGGRLSAIVVGRALTHTCHQARGIQSIAALMLAWWSAGGDRFHFTRPSSASPLTLCFPLPIKARAQTETRLASANRAKSIAEAIFAMLHSILISEYVYTNSRFCWTPGEANDNCQRERVLYLLLDDMRIKQKKEREGIGKVVAFFFSSFHEWSPTSLLFRRK